MAQVTQRAKPGLPQQWAAEIALATSSDSLPVPDASFDTPTSAANNPPGETLGGRVFDKQLDGFLDRFQQEIVAARKLKDALDRLPPTDAGHASQKDQFKKRMDRIRALFATEGEDFVSGLEKRNPKLTMAACGENTLELAQGIERLETAVKEEETKRSAHPSIPDRRALKPNEVAVEEPAVSNVTPPSPAPPPRDVPLSTSNGPAAVGQTLNNLNSDETLQLMQSDIQALKLELMRLQRSKANADPFPPSGPLSLPPTKPLGSLDTNSANPYSIDSLTPENNRDAAKGLPPSLLANNNVSVVRVTGRAIGFAPTYVSHLEQMKSRLEALEKKPLSRRAKSAARLGRTQTMGSLYDSHLGHDENHNPNVTAMITPPRGSRRMKHRSISTQSPLNYSRGSPPTGEPFVHMNSPGSTPSPRKASVKKGEGAQNGTTPARLFFDAPEEMLSRPQSHAAARDIQRYSLKVARRFGPSEPAPKHVTEPRAKSAVTVSPNRRVMRKQGISLGHAISDVGTAHQNASPSTIDTNGSGGRVVEEIEGDMWVRKGVVWKRWRRRYASIVSHQFFGKVMCLFSYDSSGGVISTRSQIVVLHSSLCRALREKVEIGGQERFMFVLRTSSKEYYFASETDEIRRNWIRELRDAARKDNSRLVHPAKGRSMAFRNRMS